MRLLGSGTAPVAREPLRAHDDDWAVAVGDSVIVAPPDDAEEAFWLARVVERKPIDNQQGIKIHYYELVDKKADPYTGAYQLVKGLPHEHFPVHGSCVQDVVRMTKPQKNGTACHLVSVVCCVW